MDAKESNVVIRAEALGLAPQDPAWSFEVPRGGALWISDADSDELVWLDWLTGIAPPPAGRVFWKDVDWRDRAPDEAAAERSRIGCVFATGGLIANLDMDENVWLPARIHRRESAAEAIERWARFFGVWPLPSERAPAVRERDRRRILWVRAFAGKPEALILERPLQNTPAEDRRLLLEAVRQVRAAGCAVIWLQDEMDAETQAALAPLAHAVPQMT